VRHSAQLLRLLLPTLKYKFDTLLIRGQIAFEEWEAEASKVEVHDGIDAFVITKGKIRIQTIWYDSEPRKKGAR
ncbi:MAG TPA: nuclear transport factor 2 family protein, partial [Thermoanaerobaculia bacterium]|nr:nuclear transport factor 2 family protein [Thermoanaerobaculia bacterium]